MPVVTSREYRAAKPFEVRAAEENEQSFIVEGYATTFDDPYVMYSFDGVDYTEQIDARAFDEADMSDVILQYDHSGMVFARQKNGTLTLEVDDHGLKVVADLSSTKESQRMYAAIKAGLVCDMSFAFSVEEDSYNNKDHCRTITKIKKVYDVSAVSIPANPDTEISARSYFDGVIEADRLERLKAEALEARKRKLRLTMEV